MPFQSEKQRRYLWANEPEIARDWTDTYGSRVRKQNGGIMETALMQLAKTYGMRKAMEMLGMGTGSDQPVDPNLPSGYFGNLMSNFNPVKSMARFGMNKVLSGGGSGIMKAALPIGVIMALAAGVNKHRLALTGYTTQRGWEKARQDRINMKRQSKIIDTLQSGKYVPGWEKTAFDRVQKLGENLDLVDAADVGLTTKKHIPSGPTIVPHGGGGRNGQPHGTDTSGSFAGKGSSNPFGRARGGLAGLWQR